MPRHESPAAASISSMNPDAARAGAGPDHQPSSVNRSSVSIAPVLAMPPRISTLPSGMSTA
jgi:hypothetical protein